MYGSCNAAKIDLKHHDLAAVKQNPEQDLGVKGDPLTVSVLAVFVHLSEFRDLFQAWLKKAEDQASAILLDAKNIQRAQDKLLIHKVCVLLCKEI